MIATITKTSINNESEIDKYLKQPAIIFTEDIDILKWWDNNQNLKKKTKFLPLFYFLFICLSLELF
ncbi:hypothetical protein BpHYR1_046929 [Brachionus plicatilis]|uniref:Uncharacterized protein n=1 Tax=Brachionus plicatilis TaxID=10195 RepID=A0A3M7S5X7_BRAPC|nr:hypothetical protein BpHYR1_046929 [Brachionus plicatilis]